MSGDLILDNFVDRVDRKLVARYIKVLNALLILVTVYSFLHLLEWFFFFKKPIMPEATLADKYNYYIAPFIVIPVILAGIISWAYLLKGNKIINNSFANNDAALLNNGYKNCYTGILISIIIFAISIIEYLLAFSLETKVILDQ